MVHQQFINTKKGYLFQFTTGTLAIFVAIINSMYKAKPILTADGSHTLYSDRHKAHYHSLNGAVQESKHIFIKNGFDSIQKNGLKVLEVGFGTGLNAALTATRAFDNKLKVDYYGIELYPLDQEIYDTLNYSSVLSKEESDAWQLIVTSDWGIKVKINEYFTINKINNDFTKIELTESFDLIYFDAFAPDDQPELWEPNIFKKLFDATLPNGILVTYCSKGIVKQALRDSGYKVVRLQGPPGKRHMLRAIKIQPIDISI